MEELNNIKLWWIKRVVNSVADNLVHLVKREISLIKRVLVPPSSLVHI